MSLFSVRHASQRGEARLPAVLLLLLVLAASWMLWSGLYKPLLLGLGAFSCLLSAYLGHRMGFFRHQALMGLLPRLPGYWWWLLGEIAMSSIEVARLILKPAMPVSPVLVELEAQSESEVGQVILGNSITLSPGTVTLDVHKGKFLVHCLTSEGAEALRSGEVARRAARLEGS
ncbi:Na+/H+ antiporter subunit E [Pseudohalioglobus lutimaris]|uniref:Sodium:proton antiporter n=1 Tax=Pseudohalioglobus lutimaris TaxID=1737061 RepID=A0A2N5WZK5_9GAMM|nr:Na+/H+ antiporter subunit E [Pseudohalioglobus lutimaris]PLW67667.1 sodium:proton antiporter [Pseudohalioglobus lutimaris]